jgi:4-amino-4-deoxy-L-arabinose transferase-like glycosyltransferase
MQRPADLFSWKNLSAILVVVVSMILIIKITRENQLFFTNPSYYSIADTNGVYLKSDAGNSNFLYVTGLKIDLRERFTVIDNPDGSKAISEYYKQGIRADKDNNFELYKPNKTLPGKYYFEPSGKGYVIRDQEHHYFAIGKDSRLIAGNRESAAVFSIVPAKIVIPFLHYFLVISGLFCLFLSVVLFQVYRRTWPALLILMAGAFLLMVYCITMFDFLFLWDEQYHALVAKHMIGNPFVPVLNTFTYFPYDYQNWSGNHIWLHKQPLFLWQMALAIRVFGLHAWAVRIPDLVMEVSLVWVIFRMGSLVADRQTGFWAAFFFAGSDFLFKLASGCQFTDHNDVTFLFYVTLSTWTWLEFENTEGARRKWMFLVLTGIFAGCAVLVKWLPGLMIFGGWGFYILITREQRVRMMSYTELILGFIITLAVFLPWQVYILNRFPVESYHEFRTSAGHFLTAIEGHSGDGLGYRYYFNNHPFIFGISWKLLLLCIPIFLLTAKRKKQAAAVVFMIIAVFAFYTLARTKMPAFIFILAGMVYIILASLYSLIEKAIELFIPARFFRILLFTVLLIAAFDGIFRLNFKYTSLYSVNSDTSSCAFQRTIFAKWYQDFDKVIPRDEQKNYVVLNVPPDECVQMLFYTDLKGVNYKLDKGLFYRLKQEKNVKIAYIVYPDETAPDYILQDSQVLKIYPENILLRMTDGCR